MSSKVLFPCPMYIKVLHGTEQGKLTLYYNNLNFFSVYLLVLAVVAVKILFHT